MSECLTSNRLQQLLANTLEPTQAAIAEGHLNECARCQEFLGRLAGDQDIPRRPASDTGESNSSLLDTVKINLVQSPMLAIPPASQANGEDHARGARTPGLKGKLEPPQRSDSLGRFGEFEVLKLLGSGGMGAVYQALGPKAETPVAIKVLQPHAAHNKQARARFLREAKYLSIVSHKNVIGVFAVEEIRRTPCIVMEEVAGATLQQLVSAKGAFDWQTIWRIAVEAARGLEAAHSRGILHRDIKPANIMLSEDFLQVKLADFGLAKTMQDVGLTASDAVPGTPEYMSPEQLSGGQVGFASDLFSLGTVLYFLATGTNPFSASNILRIFHNVRSVEVPSLDAVIDDFDTRLAAIIASLMDKDPKKRPRDTGALLELLDELS